LKPHLLLWEAEGSPHCAAFSCGFVNLREMAPSNQDDGRIDLDEAA
jgi:hypothetical protein